MAPWLSGLLDRPLFYSVFHGAVSGRKEWYLRRELQREIYVSPVKIVDVGCGPGTNARLFLDKTRFEYLGLDINPDYVRKAAGKYPLNFDCVDITTDWKPRTLFDVVLINSVLHHLTDAQSEALLSAAAGCLSPTGRCIILEMIRPETPTLWNAHNRLVIGLDRGQHCRKKQELEMLLQKSFRISLCKQFDLTIFLVRFWDMRLYVCEKK